jgi:hypothetical protein
MTCSGATLEILAFSCLAVWLSRFHAPECQQSSREEKHGPPRRIIEEKRPDGKNALVGVSVVGNVADEAYESGSEEDSTTLLAILRGNYASAISKHGRSTETSQEKPSFRGERVVRWLVAYGPAYY